MRKRRFYVPEVIQISASDCGPAALKAVLEGFGIAASYERLRAACYTHADGTSIDDVEEVANALGLRAEQTIVPLEHLGIAEAGVLPAILIVKDPIGEAHFIVVWRRVGQWFQIMDPASGRRWIREKDLREWIFLIRHPVPAELWAEWARSEEFYQPLVERVRRYGGSRAAALAALRESRSRPGWRPLAAIDAALRAVDELVAIGAVETGREATACFERLVARYEASDNMGPLEEQYWHVRPLGDVDGTDMLEVCGAVIIALNRAPEEAEAMPAAVHDASQGGRREMLARALEERPVGTGRRLLALLAEDGLFAPAALCFLALAAAAGVIGEAMLFQGLIDAIWQLGPPMYRVGAVAAVVIFSFALLLIEWPLAREVLRCGRKLELRMRLTFLAKLPRLAPHYIRSRLVSDLAARAHRAHLLRELPQVGRHVVHTLFALLVTGGTIVWLDPGLVWLVIGGISASLFVPWLTYPAIRDRDLLVQTYDGNLTLFYLDALLGLAPIKTSGAEPVIEMNYADYLRRWQHGILRLQRAIVSADAVQGLVGVAFAVTLIYAHVHVGQDQREVGSLLLLAYLVLSVPVLSQQLAYSIRMYPRLRNVAQRQLEPLGAEEWPEDKPELPAPTPASGEPRQNRAGVAIRLSQVSVQSGAAHLLRDVDLTIPAASHLAIVGTSGAGKSTLLKVLIGLVEPTSGHIFLDGAAAGSRAKEALRNQTAWVDASVQLWNRSLLENLVYGNAHHSDEAMPAVMDAAELSSVLERLPEGFQTHLGEGGGLLSGGEGQRVRLARAMLRPQVRLVLLDEAFRGLERAKRRALLQRARHVWRQATLLCVTHDIIETRDFARVLVVENGAVIEDGAPEELLSRPDSRYRALYEAEEALRDRIWQSADWRHITVGPGSLREEGSVSGRSA